MKKKILFINGHLNPGGVEKSLVDILKSLDPDKYEAELLLLEEYGDYIKEIPTYIKVRLVSLEGTYGPILKCILQGVKKGDFESIKRRIVFALTRYFGIEIIQRLNKSIVGTKKYDYVIGFRPGIVSALAIYATCATKKILWWHHGEINLDRNSSKDFRKEGLRADIIVAVSNGCKEMLGNEFPELNSKIIVIPNMIDIPAIKCKAVAYIPFEHQDDCLTLVTVGRLSPEKHVENVLSAAAKLKEGKTNFRWFIVGDGVCMDKLKKDCEMKKLKDKVYFVGRQSNPYPWIKYADILVHPSYVESQCLVALEAMTLGTPCVITESLGPKEFCVNGINCVMVEKSAEALYQGIMDFSQYNRQEIISNAKATSDGFGTEYIISKIDQVLD